MNIESKIQDLVDQVNNFYPEFDKIFVSLGKPNIKAQVKLLKNKRNLERDVMKRCQKFKKQAGSYPQWIKLDIVTDTQTIRFDNVAEELITTRRNYIDFGIAMDNYWNLTFLPEEINANAFVRPKKVRTLYFYPKKILIIILKNIRHIKKVLAMNFTKIKM